MKHIVRRRVTAAILAVLGGVMAACASGSAQGATAGSTAPEESGQIMDGPGMMDPAAVSENTMADSFRHLTALKGDFMYSPYSLKNAFRILYPAADGESKREMDLLFGFGDGEAEKMAAVDAEMVFKDGVGVKSVNKAFVNDRGMESGLIHPEVLGTEDVDLRTFGSGTVSEINGWVEENTEHRIKNLLAPGTVTEDTRAVLVNCLYFLLHWDANEYQMLWNGEKEVPAFSGEAFLSNIKEDGPVDILRLPYDPVDGESEKEHRYSMVVICDREDSTEDKVDLWMSNKSDKELLAWADFSDYGYLEGYTDGEYTVPCFEMETKTSLRDVLMEQGLEEPFNSQTHDFDRFAPVYADDVIQGTFIRCDEKGTEAAAATAIVLNETAMLEEPVVKRVVADSTFAFLIVDETAHEILFMGRVSDPKYEKKE